MSAPGLMPDRKGTAECRLCERRRCLTQLTQGGGHNNFRCIDKRTCERRVLANSNFDATEDRITTRKHSRTEREHKLPTSCGACEEEKPINQHGLCEKCESNFVAANPGKAR